jgi:hypothetical protein
MNVAKSKAILVPLHNPKFGSHYVDLRKVYKTPKS